MKGKAAGSEQDINGIRSPCVERDESNATDWLIEQPRRDRIDRLTVSQIRGPARPADSRLLNAVDLISTGYDSLAHQQGWNINAIHATAIGVDAVSSFLGRANDRWADLNLDFTTSPQHDGYAHIAPDIRQFEPADQKGWLKAQRGDIQVVAATNQEIDTKFAIGSGYSLVVASAAATNRGPVALTRALPIGAPLLSKTRPEIEYWLGIASELYLGFAVRSVNTGATTV